MLLLLLELQHHAQRRRLFVSSRASRCHWAKPCPTTSGARPQSLINACVLHQARARFFQRPRRRRRRSFLVASSLIYAAKLG